MIRSPITTPGPLNVSATITAGTTYPDITIKAPLGPKFQALPEWTGGQAHNLIAFTNTTESQFFTSGGAIYDAEANPILLIGDLSSSQVALDAPRFWYPPTLGATRNISTRKGLRTIQTADTFEGMLIEPAMTNKVTARKSNPTDTTGVTGAGGATVTRVLDTAALTAGGYQDICTTFYDYELSIPQNGTISIAGAVANLNKHSVSLDMRLVSGTGVQLGLTGQTSDVTLTAAFSRQKKENLTPLAITDVITITNLNADTAVVRCILPGLEESAFCTSRIAPAADTAASQTRAASVPSASTSGVFPSTGQDFAMFMRVVPEAAGQSSKRFLGMNGQTASDYFSVGTSSTNLCAIIKAAGSVPAPVTQSWSGGSYAAGDIIEVMAVQTIHGISIRHRKGVGGSWVAWSQTTTAAAKMPIIVNSTYQIGAQDNVAQFTSNYPRTAIIAMPPKATLAEYQTWIEEELTRRGLI